jgi:hypothetical protein
VDPVPDPLLLRKSGSVCVAPKLRKCKVPFLKQYAMITYNGSEQSCTNLSGSTAHSALGTGGSFV